MVLLGSGEPVGIRTQGPKIKSLVLYQLSYGLTDGGSDMMVLDRIIITPSAFDLSIISMPADEVSKVMMI